MASSSPTNSTNVRVESPLDPWPVPRHPARAPRVALASWALLVAGASLDGVFARLEPEAYAALIAFAVGFTLLTAWTDAELRETLHALPHKLATALMLDAVLLASLAVSRDAAGAPWTGFPAAMALLVLLPLALVVHAAAARARAVRRAPGASPGAKRAAT
jgi:hypothetical protein